MEDLFSFLSSSCACSSCRSLAISFFSFFFYPRACCSATLITSEVKWSPCVHSVFLFSGEWSVARKKLSSPSQVISWGTIEHTSRYKHTVHTHTHTHSGNFIIKGEFHLAIGINFMHRQREKEASERRVVLFFSFSTKTVSKVVFYFLLTQVKK